MSTGLIGRPVQGYKVSHCPCDLNTIAKKWRTNKKAKTATKKKVQEYEVYDTLNRLDAQQASYHQHAPERLNRQTTTEPPSPSISPTKHRPW